LRGREHGFRWALERLGREVGALEGLIRHQPVPENDRMTQRYRGGHCEPRPRNGVCLYLQGKP